jgi:serine protease Do
MKKVVLAFAALCLSACVTIQATPDYTELAGKIVPSNVSLIGTFTNPWTGQVFTDRTYCSGVQIKNKQILTAGHCVAVTEGRFEGKIKVKLADGRVFLATVVKSTLKESEEIGGSRDAALLQIDEELPNPATVGTSKDVKVGQQIAIVGNSFGQLEHSFSVGEVSFVGRILGGFRFIQSTAAAAGGNSGGGVYNMKGELIGLLTHGISDSYTLTSPIDSILDQLAEVAGDSVTVMSFTKWKKK